MIGPSRGLLTVDTGLADATRPLDGQTSSPTADVLFDEHRRGVFRYLSRFVGHADAAHDLTQEVFLRVARSKVPETTVSGSKAWLFTIARNVALNHVRDRGRRPVAVELAEAGRPATQELSAALREALAALPDVDRDVFLLREAAGLTYDEIAAACELSADAVRSRLHRARERLRQALGSTMSQHSQMGVRLGGKRT
jgi:RNA polymerase sigma-70 factor, ECF subfamily